MRTFEILLGLVALCVALAVLARRLHLPVAVTLVLGGMGLALIPDLPGIALDPELALALFLPPLLQVSAYRTDWPAFRVNIRPILLLAIGAVFFSTAAVAVVAHLIVPGLPWWAAITLGAIVAPPDAVAASSVLRPFHLPKRIVVVLEGESLINDASALVLYRFAVAAVAAGTVSYERGALQFVGMALGGWLVGWLTGRLAMWVFAKTDETMLDIAVSLLAGFVAYLAAEAIHASGVLGAVACGLVLGRQQHAEFSGRTRLEMNAVWNFAEFLLASLVFMLIGLQLREIVRRLDRFDPGDLSMLAVAVSVTLIASRFCWVYASAGVRRLLPRPATDTDPLPPWTHQAVVSWAGMRGVVSLAAALALPARFPARDIIVFLAFCAIFATLVVQGTTLGWLVRRLHVAEPDAAAPEPQEIQVRAEIAGAALEAVKSQIENEQGGVANAATTELVDEYTARADRASGETQDPQHASEQRDAQQRVRLAGVEAGRQKLAEHVDRVDVDAHRTLAKELDLEEQQIKSALGQGE